MVDIIDELRQTAGNLINGVIDDGEVPVSMLTEAADEIERLRGFAQQTLPPHVEKTEAGTINWKMEVDRLNRLLANAQGQPKPAAWGRMIDGEAVTVSRIRTAANDEPLYASPPTQSSLTDLVNEQAEDEGLWFIDATCSEAYLQAALRRLHAAIEGTAITSTDGGGK